MLALLAGPSGLAGQQGWESQRAPPDWAGDLSFLAGNAALGGVAAGTLRALRGGSFWDGMRSGALGGALSYGGRRIAAERFPGAGLLGREIGAVGGSIVRNAAQGGGPLDELVLPLWIARVYVAPGGAAGAPRARVKLDVPTAVASLYLALRADTELDVGRSLSSGTPVLYRRERWREGGWFGSQLAGVIWLQGNPNDPYPETPEAAVLAHERVHVLQYDASFLYLGEPVDALLTRRLPGGAWVERHLDLGAHIGGWGLANWLVPYGQRPWEHEAHFLGRASSDDR